MEAWKAILIAFGGNAALIAVLVWLAKLLLGEWVKNTSVERQIVFAKLHEKRTDAISNIHQELYEYVAVCKNFLMAAMHTDEEEKQELLDGLDQASRKFRKIFLENKLYLDVELCKKIESAFKDTQMPSFNYIFALGAYTTNRIGKDDHEKEWEKAFVAFTDRVPSLLVELENEFRKLLGSQR